jgi:AraC-like DNA-binding protein
MATSHSNVETAFWQVPDLKAECLLQAEFERWDCDVHAHDTACFALLTAGQNSLQIQHQTFYMQPGEICAIDANVPHAGGPRIGDGSTSTDACSVRVLFVDLNDVGVLLGDERRHLALTGSPIVRDATLCAALHDFHVCSGGTVNPLYRDERYLAFAARLFELHIRGGARANASVGNEGHAVQRAREFLHAYLDQTVGLTDIASAATLPPYRLLRAFQRATGMSPHGYQRQARLREAMRLIRRGRSLSEAATETGFADQAHLTRTFRKFMGITPGTYQAAFSVEANGSNEPGSPRAGA